MSRNLVLLVIPLFILVFFVRNIFGRIIKKIPIALPLKFFLIGLIVGFFTESLVFVGGFGNIHDNLLIDFFLLIGLYGSMPLVWFALLRKYEFSLGHIFLLSGIFGIIIEQDFAILLSFNPFLYFYVFMVYGSIMSLPFLVTSDEFTQYVRIKPFSKFVVAFISLLFVYVIGTLWAFVMQSIFQF